MFGELFMSWVNAALVNSFAASWFGHLNNLQRFFSKVVSFDKLVTGIILLLLILYLKKQKNILFIWMVIG